MGAVDLAGDAQIRDFRDEEAIAGIRFWRVARMPMISPVESDLRL